MHAQPVQVVAMNMPTHKALVLSLLCACVVRPALGAPTSCYVTAGAAQPVTTSSLGLPMPADMVCTRYCHTCIAGDTSCTSAQISASAVVGVYGYMDSLTAGQMAGQTVTYPNFYSCTTTNCNVYTANCSASGAAPSAASRQALHAAAMLLAALMVIALQ